MKVVDLAKLATDACDAEGVEHLLTGAMGTSFYGIPRSTKDVDLVLALSDADELARVMRRLEGVVEFDTQVRFDTLTWGKRLVGTLREPPHFKIELFELFDDPFVQMQFSRRIRRRLEDGWEPNLPTVEDVVVQKLRWARGKDLVDAGDVLAVQGTASLDMDYVRRWCREHGSEKRLDAILAKLPDI